MTYIVSGGALNSTHSLTHCLTTFFGSAFPTTNTAWLGGVVARVLLDLRLEVPESFPAAALSSANLTIIINNNKLVF